ncbi:HEAT repeat domain-containing protein [Wenjunlia tyrosinilytica]|nr:HEAT repeat domain-containing protein [Wenjunlia tyrosinilytica]
MQRGRRGADASDAAAGLLAALGSERVERRCAAAGVAARSRDRAVLGALVRMVGDSSAQVRASAADALAGRRADLVRTLADERTLLSVLEGALLDSDRTVALTAGLILRYSGGAPGRRRLASALLHRTSAVRATAADALRGCVEPAVVTALSEALRDRRPGVRRAAARALVGTAHDGAVAGLGRLVADVDTETRAAAVEALSQSWNEGAGEALASAADDAEPVVREGAAKGLERHAALARLPRLLDHLERGGLPARGAAETLVWLLGPHLHATPEDFQDARACPGSGAAPARQRVLTALARALDADAEAAPEADTTDGGVELRTAAMAALGSAPDAPAAVADAALVSGIADPAPTVRAAAFRGLWLRGSATPEAVRAAVTAVAGGAGEWEWAAALLCGAWERSGRETGAELNALTALLRHPDAERRLTAALCLCPAPEEAVEEVAVALDDDDSAVRRAAAASLAACGSPFAHEALLFALVRPDAGVRTAAEDACADAATDLALPVRLEAALRDPMPQVRVAALRALGRRADWRGDRRAPEVIEELLHDGSAVVRLQAAYERRLRTTRAAPPKRDQERAEIPYATRPHPATVGAIEPGEGYGRRLTEASGPFAEVWRAHRDAFHSRGKPPADRRHLNTWLCEAGTSERVARSAPLRCGTPYELALNIGPLMDDSAVLNSRESPLPDTPSVAGSRLHVLLLSDDFDVPDEPWPLDIPVSGPSATARIPVRTPVGPRSALLHLWLFADRTLLVAAVLRAGVGAEGHGYHVVVGHTLGADPLGPARPSHGTDVLVHSGIGRDGEHRIAVYGGPGHRFAASLNDARALEALKIARTALVAAHFTTARDGRVHSRYGPTGALPPAAARDDLARLARLGRRLYTMVVLSIGRGAELDAMLRDTARVTGRPARIQITGEETRLAAFPWQLVYDIPCAGGETALQDCPLLGDWLAGRLGDKPPASCPHPHPENTLCPSGFWGFAHEVAAPVWGPTASGALEFGARGGRPDAVVAFSTTLDATLRQGHLDRLNGRLDPVEKCPTIPGLRASLASTSRDVVYFYCHGRRRPLPGSGYPEPTLEIGRDEEFAPDDLYTWAQSWPREHWGDNRPLVVMNGCHTGELTPHTLVDFVTVFQHLGAAGCVATEIALEQSVAGRAAELMIGELARGRPVVEAVRTMRWLLLRMGNLMGLAYTPYCHSGLVPGFEPEPVRAARSTAGGDGG